MIYESSININGTEYPLVFNGYAERAIQHRFGTIKSLGTSLVLDGGEPDLDAVLDLANILLEAGQLYYGVIGKDCPTPPKSLEAVVNLLDPSFIEKLLTTISKGMTREVETVSKNGEAKQTN